MSPSLIVPLIVGCALFMEKMDATIISTSLPVLARHFMQDPLTLKLALTSYVISVGIFIPVCGWVADKVGARTVFRAAILVFMTGSLLCSMADSLFMFIAARILQGVGGAMMVPVGRIIMVRSIDKSDLIGAMSFIAMPALLGPVIGPPLGGFITTYFNWHWIFLINIPFCLLGLYLAGRYMENFREEGNERLDLMGFVLSAGASCGLMLGFSLVGSPLIPHWQAAMLCIAGFVCAWLYWQHAHRTDNPILDLRLLRIPSFRASVIGGSLFRIALGAIPFLLPLFLQVGLHMRPFESGMITCASALGAFFMKTLATRMLGRYGFRRILLTNALLSGIALMSYTLFQVHTPYALMFALVFLGGLFPSLQFTCLNALSYADIPPRDTGRATSLASVVQQLSLGFGVVVAGIVVQLTSTIHGHDSALENDFWPAFVVLGVCSIMSMFLMRRLPKKTGTELLHHARD